LQRARYPRKTAEISDYSSGSGKTCRVNLAYPANSSDKAAVEIVAMID